MFPHSNTSRNISRMTPILPLILTHIYPSNPLHPIHPPAPTAPEVAAGEPAGPRELRLPPPQPRHLVSPRTLGANLSCLCILIDGLIDWLIYMLVVLVVAASHLRLLTAMSWTRHTAQGRVSSDCLSILLCDCQLSIHRLLPTHTYIYIHTHNPQGGRDDQQPGGFRLRLLAAQQDQPRGAAVPHAVSKQRWDGMDGTWRYT